MGYYKYVSELYQNLRRKYSDPEYADMRELIIGRKKDWRKGRAIVRVDRPLRIDKARQYGYKAKQGFVISRVRVRRGVTGRPRPAKGRRPKRAGQRKIAPSKGKQRVAEERAARRFMNLEVLGSYWVWEDGQYKWFEVILLDPSHPVIKSDKDVSWVTEKQHSNRVFRGLTPSGKKGRGLRKKGIGAEKVRPSIRAKGRKAK
jgi:large subunit ribosomal protein L15e